VRAAAREAAPRGQDARGGGRGKGWATREGREREGREKESEGEGRGGGSPWDPKSGDNRHRITPRARGGREVEERERERELLFGKNQMRERESMSCRLSLCLI
jgi:hypothetical protein